MDKAQLIEAALDDDGLLANLIPGGGQQVGQVREQIAGFARNTSVRGAMLIGPVGSGKSTIARIMAFMRYIHFCGDEKRHQLVSVLQFDGPYRLDKRLMDFYEEMNLTGLVPQLAQTQLFGVARRAATEVDERPGIFERAMTGHQPKGRETVAAQVTGGVVFLDEIGDLAPEFQPLLLSLLTGAEVFRVGGEGNQEYGYSFNGVVLAATWKNPFDGSLRPDLVSRLSDYVIRIPGLNERGAEFEEIVNVTVADIRARHLAQLERLEQVRTDVVSRPKIEQKRGMTLALDRKDISLLRRQDWGKRGDMRGLRQLLERCFHDRLGVEEALARSASFELVRLGQAGGLAASFVDELCGGDDGPIDLTEEVRRIERQTRSEVAERLKSDPVLLTKLAVRAGLSETSLRQKLGDLVRDRSRGRNEAH
jgi:transcriptional regulator of aromatic amino acid metabolism